MDCARFLAVCEQAANNRKAGKGIGTLGEKCLHAALKDYLCPDREQQEVAVGRYVADILCADGVIEIQTRGFERLREKLAYFLELGPVTVVYPIAHRKWLSWIDEETGEVGKKRRSPKVGSVYDAFYELYKIKPLLSHPNLRLHLLLVDVEDYRRLNGWSCDKKRGSTRSQRIPTALAGELCVSSPTQYRLLVPDALEASFTTKDYAAAAKLPLNRAQTALNVLCSVGAVRKAGKQGRLVLYTRAEEEKTG